MNKKNKIYILERLKNFGTDEDKDVYKHCDDGTYSIEHIIPQSLTPHWMQCLGSDYKNIHNVYIMSGCTELQILHLLHTTKSIVIVLLTRRKIWNMDL